MSFTLTKTLTKSPVLQLELVEESGVIKLVGYTQGGSRWVIMEFFDDGTFRRNLCIKPDIGVRLSPAGRIAESF